MNNPIIEFKNVYKEYQSFESFSGGLKNFLFTAISNKGKVKSKKFLALSDISFSINKGDCVAIVGRNGSGKSTTLGMIAGVLKPNKGSVIIRGRVSPLLELGGGFHPELSGRENIIMNGVLLGLSLKQVREKLNEIIAFSELNKFIDRPIRIYSSGMLARLAFSVVAHLDPDILLIDEILAVGDIGFQKKCYEKIKSFKGKGVTIVLVTHSLSDVEALCEKTIWIHEHKIKMQDSTTKVLTEYQKIF